VINHFRTLLLNVDGSVPMTNFLAEEIVDPRFKEVRLPTPLQQVRRVLFGSDPDRHMLNLRARQLLALVHGTPLVEHVYALDSRVTYGFKDETLVLPQAWKPVVNRVAGYGTLSVLGEPDKPDVLGRVHHRYSVTVASPGTATIEQVTKPFQKVDFGFAPNDRIPLQGSGCDIRLSSDASGQEFYVDIYARPTTDLYDLCNSLTKLGEPTLNYVFGIVNVEPWVTFSSLFFRKLELPLRLSAIVTAVVLRTEEVRNAAG
jgi:hypothetical protein